eukprot:359270-Chlamydomonas_euryale.AAC.9
MLPGAREQPVAQCCIDAAPRPPVVGALDARTARVHHALVLPQREAVARICGLKWRVRGRVCEREGRGERG